MRLQNLGIARKLWLGVIFLIAANVVIVGFSGIRTAKLTASFDAAFAQLDTKLALAQEWASQSEAEANRAAVLSHTPGTLDPLALVVHQGRPHAEERPGRRAGRARGRAAPRRDSAPCHRRSSPPGPFPRVR